MTNRLMTVLTSVLVFTALWAGVPASATEPACGQDQAAFPDYQPKTSPDTVSDYRPIIVAELDRLPPAALDELPRLIQALKEHQVRASASPGEKRPGNVALGADPEEYVPSDEELIAGEIGRRIRRVVESTTKGDLERVLAGAGLKDDEIKYNEFSFRHMDVMGSGRYFYASDPAPVRVPLR